MRVSAKVLNLIKTKFKFETAYREKQSLTLFTIYKFYKQVVLNWV